MVGDGYNTCEVEDNCTPTTCPDPNQICEMDECGELKCPCNPGFTDNGFGGCTDTNECNVDKPTDTWTDTTVTVADKLELASWETARKFCKKLGKKLFTPDTEFKFSLLAPLANQDIWIGMRTYMDPRHNKQKFRESFRWLQDDSTISDNEGIVAANDPMWKPGKPSASLQLLCVKLKKHMKKWENFHCDMLKRFYCEEPDGSIYDPALDPQFTVTTCGIDGQSDPTYFVPLSCESGHEIEVLSAIYGRSSQSTCCASQQLDDGFCESCLNYDNTTYAATQCNGQNTCTIQFNDLVLGDPCPGVDKYAEIKHTCIKTSISPMTSPLRSRKRRDGTCEESELCDGDKTCINTEGSYTCDCPSPTSEGCNNTCIDINECLDSPCPGGTTCFNLDGQFLCDGDDGYICLPDKEEWEELEELLELLEEDEVDEGDEDEDDDIITIIIDGGDEIIIDPNEEYPCQINPCVTVPNSECIADKRSEEYSVPFSQQVYNCICKFGFQMDMGEFYEYWIDGNENKRYYCKQSEECMLYDAWDDPSDPDSYYTDIGMATFILSKYTPNAIHADQTAVTNQYMHDFPKHICSKDHLCVQPKSGGYQCECPTPVTFPTIPYTTTYPEFTYQLSSTLNMKDLDFLVDGTMKTYWSPEVAAAGMGMGTRSQAADQVKFTAVRISTVEQIPVYGIRIAISQYDEPEKYPPAENRTIPDFNRCSYEGSELNVVITI